MLNQDEQNIEINKLKSELERAAETIRSLEDENNYLKTLVEKNLNKTRNNNAENHISVPIRQPENTYDYHLKDSSLLSKFRFLGIVMIVAGVFAAIGLLLSNNKQSNPDVKKTSLRLMGYDKKNFKPVSLPEQNPYSTTPPYTKDNTSICAADSLLQKQVNNWAIPTRFTLSKNIIIAAGHNGVNDVHKPGLLPATVKTDGTNGLAVNTNVVYEGMERTLEGAVNLRTAEITQKLLQQVGFNVTYVKAYQGENLRSKMERIKHMMSGNDSFAFEVHYDDPAKRNQPGGAGVIPPNIDPTLTVNSTYADVVSSIHLTTKGISGYDIALAQEFGAYPQDWRNGLGGPRRGVTLLEIDEISKIEPYFRKAIKTGDYTDTDMMLIQYGSRVANALLTAYNNAARIDTKETFNICNNRRYE